MGHHLHRARLVALAKEQAKLIASGVDPDAAKAQVRDGIARNAAAPAPAKRKAKAKAKRRRRA
jgi:hypothetical protein